MLEAALASCATQGRIELGFILGELARVAEHRGDLAETERLAAESRAALDDSVSRIAAVPAASLSRPRLSSGESGYGRSLMSSTKSTGMVKSPQKLWDLPWRSVGRAGTAGNRIDIDAKIDRFV